MKKNMNIFMIEWNMKEHLSLAKYFIDQGHTVVGYVYWQKEIPLSSLQEALPKTYIKDASTLFSTVSNDPFTNVAAPLDIVSAIYKEKGTCLFMMDRIGARSLNAMKKDILISELTNYWYGIFKEYTPNLVIFPDTPHMVYDYIALLVAKAMGIKTLMQECTYIPDTLFFTSEIAGTPKSVVNQRTELPEKYKEFIAHKINDLNINSSYLIQEDYRLARQQISKSHIKNWSRLLELFRLMLKTKSFSYTPTRYAVGKIPNRYQEFILNFKNYYAIYSGRKTYDQLVTLTLPDKFVFYPLHFQPEKTTCPLGGNFSNQVIVIRALSASLPSGWKLVIKEHPYQFSLRSLNHLARNADFYKLLASIPNVVFAQMGFEGRYIISQAQAVGVVTGTAGFEALLARKKTIVFSTPWYSDHPSVHKFKNVEALNSFLKDENPENYKIEEYFEQLSNKLVDGTFAFDMYRGKTKIDIKETMHVILQAILKQFD